MAAAFSCYQITQWGLEKMVFFQTSVRDVKLNHLATQQL